MFWHFCRKILPPVQGEGGGGQREICPNGKILLLFWTLFHTLSHLWMLNFATCDRSGKFERVCLKNRPAGKSQYWEAEQGGEKVVVVASWAIYFSFLTNRLLGASLIYFEQTESFYLRRILELSLSSITLVLSEVISVTAEEIQIF